MSFMHIVYVVDENYAPHAAASIVSLLENTNSNQEIHIHIIIDTLSPASKFKLESLNQFRPQAKIHFKQVGKAIASFLGAHLLPPEQHQFPITAYFRLFLPSLLPELDKALYLDSDTIVVGEIEDVWKRDVANYSMLAVAETHVPGHMPLTVPYFNSGVLLINLARLRATNFEEKAKESLRQNHKIFKCADQDVLNTLYKDDWGLLPLAYNMMVAFYQLSSSMQHQKLEVWRARKRPLILHFQQTRPWVAGHRLKVDQLYWKYARKTNFKVKKPTWWENFKVITKVYIVERMDFYASYYPHKNPNPLVKFKRALPTFLGWIICEKDHSVLVKLMWYLYRGMSRLRKGFYKILRKQT